MAAKQKKQDKSTSDSVKPLGGSAAAVDNSSSKVQQFVHYFEDAKTELGKVSWPTRKEVKVTAIAVLILVVVMSIFLGIVDLLLSKVMEAILSIGL